MTQRESADKIMPMRAPVFAYWQVKTIAEIHAMAERANAIPASMFVRPPSQNSAREATALRASMFNYTNLWYYRRDLIAILKLRCSSLTKP